jgi:hypothetical protein
VVATSASLPSESARVHHEGACSSLTRWPPAAIAAATRASAWSYGEMDPVPLRARRVHLLEPERRSSAVRVHQVLALVVAVFVAEHGTPERSTSGMTSASIVTWTVCTAEGSAAAPSSRATAEI